MKGEKDRVKELEAEVKKLKAVLADTALENYAMKTLIDVVNEHYGTKRYKMEISMTEENHCYENAIAERVNGILKQEFLLDEKFENKAMAIKAARQAIDIYNNRRPHWSLNLCTPQQIHEAT